MNRGKLSESDCCSSAIDPELSTTHNTSTDGTVTWTIRSVFTGVERSGGFGSAYKEASPCRLYSLQPASAATRSQEPCRMEGPRKGSLIVPGPGPGIQGQAPVRARGKEEPRVSSCGPGARFVSACRRTCGRCGGRR